MRISGFCVLNYLYLESLPFARFYNFGPKGLAVQFVDSNKNFTGFVHYLSYSDFERSFPQYSGRFHLGIPFPVNSSPLDVK